MKTPNDTAFRRSQEREKGGKEWTIWDAAAALGPSLVLNGGIFNDKGGGNMKVNSFSWCIAFKFLSVPISPRRITTPMQPKSARALPWLSKSGRLLLIQHSCLPYLCKLRDCACAPIDALQDRVRSSPVRDLVPIVPPQDPALIDALQDHAGIEPSQEETKEGRDVETFLIWTGKHVSLPVRLPPLTYFLD
jgi:hypothetical protein